MTTFGVDVSANQGAIDWPRVKAAGVEFAIGRATLGVGTDTWIARYLKGMRAAGILPGAYAYLYHDEPSSAARQADHFIDVIGDPNGLLVALDAEQVLSPDYDRVRRDDVERFKDRWYARYPGHRLLAYCPSWFWRSGPPSAFGQLWNSRYVSTRDRSLSFIYNTVPNSFWVPYGDWTSTTILQFTSGARVPGISGVVDGDAFRGTRAALSSLAVTAPGGGTVQPAPAPAPAGDTMQVYDQSWQVYHIPVKDPKVELFDTSFAHLAYVSDDQDGVSFLGVVSPNGSHYRLIRVTTGGVNQVALVHAVPSDVTLTPFVDDTPFDQADMDTATATLKAELDTATKALAACQTDAANQRAAGFEDALEQLDAWRLIVKPTT